MPPKGTECAQPQPSMPALSFTRPTVPSECRRILIVGAGGFGREVLQWTRDAWPEQASKISGFLSADPARPVPLPIVGDPAIFEPEDGDALLLAIGIPHTRRLVADSLRAKGGRFLTLVHPTALVHATAHLGAGSILCPYSIVSDSARLGECVLLNYHSSLAHDASAGDYAVLSPYATLAGGAAIAEEAFLGLHASVGPGKRVGARSKVSANSTALVDVPKDAIVFGVPGRVVANLAGAVAES